LLNSSHFNFVFLIETFIAFLEKIFSIERKASEAANNPIITGIKSIPPDKFVLPKVYLGTPPVGSIPTVAINKPIKPEINPLTKDLPAILEIIDTPNNANPKVSGALNLRANSANCGATKISTITLNIPPTAEEIVEIVKAL